MVNLGSHCFLHQGSIDHYGHLGGTANIATTQHIGPSFSRFAKEDDLSSRTLQEVRPGVGGPTGTEAAVVPLLSIRVQFVGVL